MNGRRWTFFEWKSRSEVIHERFQPKSEIWMKINALIEFWLLYYNFSVFTVHPSQTTKTLFNVPRLDILRTPEKMKYTLNNFLPAIFIANCALFAYLRPDTHRHSPRGGRYVSFIKHFHIMCEKLCIYHRPTTLHTQVLLQLFTFSNKAPQMKHINHGRDESSV